jgi:dimethylamine/trimethylamine dehydrogenase
VSRPHKWDILFEPIAIGPNVLKNRFYATPQCLGAGSDRPGQQAVHRAIKAEGGWAATCLEECSIHPEHDSSQRICARLWDDADVANLSATTTAIHEWDALAGIELSYQGANSPCFDTRAIPRGPSAIAAAAVLSIVPLEMSHNDIRDVQQFYVDAAVRARDAGFDIIYVYGGSDDLAAQFLRPGYNRRTDSYGGSLRNRARFWLECLDAVRQSVGSTCTVASRLSVDSRGASGIDAADALAFVDLADDLVDFWDIRVGGLPEVGWDAGASRFYAENYKAAWHQAVKQRSQKPVLGTGRFTNPDTMAHAISSGQLDIIGAARASIADPFLPTKIRNGLVDDIRECIGCNVCVARFAVGGHLVCTQNATIGEEHRRGWHPERFRSAANHDKTVLVVGAGPAGMECALVLGRRGMRHVSLADAAPEMGGSLRWMSRLPGLNEWSRVTEHRRTQLRKLPNVDFLGELDLDRDGVEELGADIVIVATGARWAADGRAARVFGDVRGADATRDHCFTPEQIMIGGKQVGPRVLVYDTDGYFMGASLAEVLARRGHEVTFLTPHARAFPFMEYTGEGPDMLRLLRSLGVQIVTGRRLTDVEPGAATSAHVDWDEDVHANGCDSVVLVTQRVANDRLYNALAEAAPENRSGSVYRIGDCVAPRMIADAIFDGHRLAREIDTDTPAIPLPMIRERRLFEETAR